MKFTKLFAALMVAALIGIAGCDDTTSTSSEGAPTFEEGTSEMEEGLPEDPGPEGEAEAEPAAEPEAEPEAEAEAEAEG